MERIIKPARIAATTLTTVKDAHAGIKKKMRPLRWHGNGLSTTITAMMIAHRGRKCKTVLCSQLRKTWPKRKEECHDKR